MDEHQKQHIVLYRWLMTLVKPSKSTVRSCSWLHALKTERVLLSSGKNGGWNLSFLWRCCQLSRRKTSARLSHSCWRHISILHQLATRYIWLLRIFFFSKYTRTTSVKIDVLLDFYNALCCVLELTEMSMKLMDNILAENDQYIYLFLNSVSWMEVLLLKCQSRNVQQRNHLSLQSKEEWFLYWCVNFMP